MLKKYMLLIVAGLVLSVTGCSVVETAGALYVKKNELCDHLSPEQKQITVDLINFKFESYPDDGLCDPDVISKEIYKYLEQNRVE